MPKWADCASRRGQGFAYSLFSIDDFVAHEAAGGGKVTVEGARNVGGRVGILLEKRAEDSNRLFGSIDIEQQLSGATQSVRVAGTRLSSRTHPTGVRMVVGADMSFGDHMPFLQGSLGYTAAGSGSRDVTANLAMKLGF